jgi:tRNA pseudouridine55 synthase
VVSGLLLVDKPLGVSSHGVVAMARKALGTKKVGHAGTLDPAASGLLVLGVGPGTRLLTYMVGLDKTYLATMRLGYSTTTDDAEGDKIEHPEGDLAACTDAAIEGALEPLRGLISQVPSTYSAIKVDGRRSYDVARSGGEVELAARSVTIHRLERGGVRRESSWIDVDLIVECSSGTYIRALARDIGVALGVGGHLVALRRTKVGPFDISQALAHDAIDTAGLLTLSEAAGAVMPLVSVSGPQAQDIRHGRAFACDGWQEGLPLAAVDGASSELLAIVECSAGRGRILMGVPPH